MVSATFGLGLVVVFIAGRTRERAVMSALLYPEKSVIIGIFALVR
jgi:hypothetical protein